VKVNISSPPGSQPDRRLLKVNNRTHQHIKSSARKEQVEAGEGEGGQGRLSRTNHVYGNVQSLTTDS